jgi:hypothetical protein
MTDVKMADDPQYNNYLRIVYEKQALKKDLQDTYRQLHSNLENNSSPHEKAALEKVMEDINTTEELIFSYQHKVEKIRETKESQMPQRAQTIESNFLTLFHKIDNFSGILFF